MYLGKLLQIIHVNFVIWCLGSFFIDVFPATIDHKESLYIWSIFLQFIWNIILPKNSERSEQFEESQRNPQRERLCMLWWNPVKFTDWFAPQSVNITGFPHNIHNLSLWGVCIGFFVILTALFHRYCRKNLWEPRKSL